MRQVVDSQSADAARDDYQSLVIACGPVGYWPLREHANDKSGHGHDGRTVGAPEFVQDVTGGWVKLDGKSYIEVCSDASFSQPTSGAGLTVEVWMRPKDLTFPEKYIHWLGKGERDNYEWAFRLHSKSSETPHRLAAYAWNPAGHEGAGAHLKEGGVAINEDAWLHITACFQPGDANVPTAGVLIYRNGEFQQGPLAPTTLYDHHPRWRIFPGAGDAPLRFGTRNDPDNCLIGGLAEIAIYPCVLAERKIRDHFEAGSRCFG